MFEKLAKVLYSSLSSEDALAHARQINEIARHFSYTQFRKSAQYCADVLKNLGLQQIELIKHPADGKTDFMDCVMPMAWDVSSARLEITKPADAKPHVL